MLRLPKQTPLPGKAVKLLAAENCRKLLQVPGKEKENPAFVCQSLTSLDGAALMLSLDREHTGLGRGLVRSLWFDRPITVWLCQGDISLRGQAWAYRCHIVGPGFSQMRALAQARNPMGDIACAWQLLPEEWTQTNETPPSPKGLSAGVPELHLDHPLLHGGDAPAAKK